MSKQNLNTVLETTTRVRNNYRLFDKFSYLTRGQRFQKLEFDGLQVYVHGLVVYQQALTEDKQLKMLELEKTKLRKEVN